MPTLIDFTSARAARHPEKAHRADQPSPAKPPWLRVRLKSGPGYTATRQIVDANGLKTVCQEAACPNMGACWEEKHATFMILGAICTRACAFCNVATGVPLPLDPEEPRHVAEAVAKLGLKHAVITSVDRDDLDDGGAGVFAAVISGIRAQSPGTTVEVLTPDFLRKPGALPIVIAARPDVFNHNIETVPRLYPAIRPGARYFNSVRLLQQAKEQDASIFTKSGLMLGLGESRDEIIQVMDDLRAADVDFLTLGQYLQPTPKHAAIARYVEPEEFDALAAIARGKGFALVAASPFTRSSFHAGDDFAKLKAARRATDGSGHAGI